MFQPLNDLVLIQVLDVQASKTIIKPDNAAEVSSKGIVRGLPPKKYLRTLASGLIEYQDWHIAESDTVMFSPHGATDVPGLKGFVLVAYPEIMGKWKEEPKALSAR